MANTAFRIAELDPNQIKTNLKEFLRSQSEFTDFDFEGSAINILLDILARNTHYMAFYLNMVASESFIDSAQLRGSLVSHAKQLGYVPRSKTGSTAYVDIIVTPSASENQVLDTLTLPKWTRFMSESNDGVNYPFVTSQAYTVSKSNGSFQFSNVSFTQGEVITRIYQVTPDNTKRKFTIPSSNVDLNHVQVSVQESSTNTYTENYTKFTDLLELSSSSKVYFIEESSSGNGVYELYFGDGTLGKKPADGNIVTVTYIDTNGILGNGANSFVLVNTINGYDDNVIITGVSAASGGSNRETIEEIRQKAPIYYTTQNRAVSKDDYKTLLLKDYTNLDSVTIWGGEENDPPIYGKLYISLKPKSGYRITDIEKENIINDLIRNRSVMTIIPEIVTPDYHYVMLRAKVNYDPDITNKTSGELQTLVRNTIITFRNSYLSKFDSKFRVSNLQRIIENSDPAITSCYVVPFLQKRITISPNVTKRYEVNFNTQLTKGQLNDKLYTTPAIKLYDSQGTERECFLEEVPYSFTGLDRIEILSAGQNYEDATVEITGDGTGATAAATIVNGKIETITITNRGENYTRAFITITSNTGTGATARAVLQFNQGTLRFYYFRANGQKEILLDNAGTIDYLTGKLVVTDLLINGISSTTKYDSNIWTFVARPENPDLTPLRNVILDLDTNDDSAIVINMVAENG